MQNPRYLAAHSSKLLPNCKNAGCHKDLNFPVVIKTPNSRFCRDANYPKYVEGFRQEGRTTENY
ncbi:hypothetical protein [Dolichospermum sp. UHCC 0315A]|uniref:hypothetical protein n=1 Tax=Dolichospermum sp. UHCC 0315A TaxID=1914871 RepID=UPI00143D89CA|nr:hypothetical protein [Dolichospermum sp. UHCC 0315A]